MGCLLCAGFFHLLRQRFFIPGRALEQQFIGMEDTVFAEYWRMADPDTFKPAQ